MGKFWRTLFNLPEKSAGTKERGEPQDAASTDPWSAAGRAAAEQATHRRRGSSAWTPIETSRGTRLWQRVLRGLVLVVLIFFLLAGVRTVFFSGGQASENQPIPAAMTFPQAAAGGVAERYVTAYYTWNEDAPKARAKALAVDLAGGEANGGEHGWDGTGKQTVTAANVSQVQAHSASEATVTVSYDVTTYKKNSKKKWVAKGTRTRAADVTVQVIDGRVSVVGAPALVATPDTPTAPSKGEAIVDDPDLSDQTRDYATSFFRAYGQDADVAALTAPGASITGIGGVELERLTEWAVQTGAGQERKATATVQWRLPEGTQLEQQYTVTLQQVTAGTTERWQVAAIHGS